MGEMFCITAPRAKRRLPQQDKLCDIVFGGRASSLVLLLIVPARLKKQSQEQSQNQAAASFAVSASAASTTSTASAASASSVSSAGTANPQSVRLDTSPTQINEISPWNPVDNAPADIDPPLTFNTLPLEIYLLIFDHLDDLADIICVGYATPYLWGIVQRTIPQLYKSMLGTWAGEPIVCVGEEIPAGDYPPGLFSLEEVETLNKEVYFWGHKHRTSPRTLFNLTYPHNGIVEYAGLTTNALASRTYDACLRRFDRYPSFALRAELLWIYTERPDFTTRQEAWILRNLTTKEFVRAEGIALDKDFIDGPFIFGIGFGEAVVARTLWTSDGTPDLRYGGQIGRGIWAGHRFDIITRSQHDEATKDEEWRDVSAEVRGEIAGIWESQFGPNWVEKGNFRRRFYEDVVGIDERDVAQDLVVAMDEFYN
ncbi:hypothetical protein VE00_08052 [Pseudogymnoascus sp. WSF 3629]|nr:hypothetical protein VE00_08052 [Pseudogymnoascus sp. WSF 3629]